MTVDAPELSRSLRVSQIGGRPHRIEIVANAAECAALALRYGTLDVARLTADLTVWRDRGETMRITGTVVAEVTQECCVTLVPVAAQVSETIDRRFRESVDADPLLIDIDFNAEDPPDPIIDGAIDLGEVVAEALALGIDPYPRAPGAAFETPRGLDGDTAETIEPPSNPFAVLKSSRGER